MGRIYLDHAATSPLRPEARAAMEEGFALWANPSSPHAEGRRAKAALEDARARIKVALHWPGEVIFASGASEALAIGLGRTKATRQIVSAVEHDAVFRAAPDAARLPVGREGRIDQAALSDCAEAVVAIQHVNSEIGLIQPIAEYASIIREAGGLLLCDCSQSAGKHPLPEADMLVISAHKFGGPVGVAALLVRDYAILEPMGGHERGYRHGTENVPGAMGMAAALETWNGSHPDPVRTSDRLRESVTANGGQIVDCGGTTSRFIHAFAHPTISAQALLIRLDGQGFAVSAGSACSSGTLKKSRVLDAFGVSDDVAARTIRVSTGWSTTDEDLERFAHAWGSLT